MASASLLAGLAAHRLYHGVISHPCLASVQRVYLRQAKPNVAARPAMGYSRQGKYPNLRAMPRSLTMAHLNQEKCVACRADSPRVTDQEVAGLHPQVAEWELISEDGINLSLIHI